MSSTSVKVTVSYIGLLSGRTASGRQLDLAATHPPVAVKFGWKPNERNHVNFMSGCLDSISRPASSGGTHEWNKKTDSSLESSLCMHRCSEIADDQKSSKPSIPSNPRPLPTSKPCSLPPPTSPCEPDVDLTRQPLIFIISSHRPVLLIS
jgi:hypothetical protein